MEDTVEIPDKVLKILTDMEERISRLETKLQTLQSRNDELLMQSMLEQNERARKDLERIWGLDRNKPCDPKKVEGILADYSDSESSVEWVRDVRDDI